MQKQSYPLLEGILQIKGLEPQATYTNADVARLFDTSIRTIQNWIANGTLPSRKLIGRARFLSCDIECFLDSSARKHEQPPIFRDRQMRPRDD